MADVAAAEAAAIEAAVAMAATASDPAGAAAAGAAAIEAVASEAAASEPAARSRGSARAWCRPARSRARRRRRRAAPGRCLEVVAQVGEVAEEEPLGLAVVGRPDHLREVDDHRPVPPQQHVVGGEVAVDEIAAEHLHHPATAGRRRARPPPRGSPRVDEPGRRVAGGVHHHLHQQHPLVEEDGAGHPHPAAWSA